MSEPARRIAIKFGTSSSSSKPNGAKIPTHVKPQSTLGKRQRPHALGHDSDSGSDEETTRHEVVTTIGGDWSESEAKRRNTKKDKSRGAKAPYVITGHKNRDWKAELKSQRSTKDRSPKENQPRSNGSAETQPADQDKQIKWGLSVTKKPVQDETDNSDVSSPSLQISTTLDPEAITGDKPEESKGGDDDAMDALLGKKRKSAKDLIIDGTPSRNMPIAPSEQDMYRRRLEEAADISTVEEYDQIPEGEFGAAMLRGMGWNGEERGSKPKEAKKRPHLMGLGSKEDEEIRKAELARKHGHRERRPRLDEYRRDKEREKQDREERRGGSYKSERERDRDRDRERRDDGHSHSHRDRDRNGHRHSERSYRR
ncbi:DExH-box splicing factor binding site-domain-containing protein [Hypoxylon crocopeplum]|nr:DExH-box splicing factor binding site-domain-containing protein [Hypoxylon crocopeplum]